MCVPMLSTLELQLPESKLGCWLYNFSQNPVRDNITTVIFDINVIKIRTEEK